jgi:hypothetical protein
MKASAVWVSNSVATFANERQDDRVEENERTLAVFRFFGGERSASETAPVLAAHEV